MYNWFESYLSNMTQYVAYNNVKSENKSITHGVTLWSILGPLLFLIYINDFSRASDLLLSIMFADDTSVFIEEACYETMINIMNVETK